MSALSNARLIMRRWHRTQDELLSGEIDANTYLDRLDAQANRFQDVVGVLGEVRTQAAARGAERRAEIRRLQRLGALLTTFLAAATVIAAAVAFRFQGGIRESAYELVVRAREAEAAVRTRDDVLAIVSHDLRNALNAMAGAVALAQEETLPEERRRQQLALATRSARGISRLIADLLDVARMEEGKLAVEPKPELVHELFVRAEAENVLEAERRGMTLLVQPPNHPVRVMADGGRVAQVLGNLIGNAVKFTPEGGSVMVEARADVRSVTFTVADTGPGIPREHLPSHLRPLLPGARERTRGGGAGPRHRLRSGPGPRLRPRGGEPGGRGHHLPVRSPHRAVDRGVLLDVSRRAVRAGGW